MFIFHADRGQVKHTCLFSLLIADNQLEYESFSSHNLPECENDFKILGSKKNIQHFVEIEAELL